MSENSLDDESLRPNSNRLNRFLNQMCHSLAHSGSAKNLKQRWSQNIWIFFFQPPANTASGLVVVVIMSESNYGESGPQAILAEG